MEYLAEYLGDAGVKTLAECSFLDCIARLAQVSTRAETAAISTLYKRPRHNNTQMQAAFTLNLFSSCRKAYGNTSVMSAVLGIWDCKLAVIEASTAI